MASKIVEQSDTRADSVGTAVLPGGIEELQASLEITSALRCWKEGKCRRKWE